MQGDYIAGLDLHKRFSQVCVLSQEGEEILNRSFPHTFEGLIQMSQALEGCSTVAMEACWGWEAMSDFLDEVLGKEVHLAHMLKVKLIAEARKKTDPIDARTLGHLERTNFLPLAHRPSREVREVRSILRQRIFFVQLRTSLKNTVHAVLGKHGMIFEGSDLFGAAGRAWLEECAVILSEGYRGVVLRAIKVMAVLDEVILEIEVKAKGMAKEDEVVKFLQTIPGIGWWSAMLIRYEIDEVERFPHPGKLVSYCGICPSVRGTGGPEKYRYGRMTKQGNAYLRHIFMEDAIPAVTSYKPWRQVYERVKAKGGGNVAKGAVAHRMVEAVYWVWKKREKFHRQEKSGQVVSSTESPVPLLAS